MYSPIVSEIMYKAELHEIPDNYLANHAYRYIDSRTPLFFDDEYASGYIRSINFSLIRRIMLSDYVYFGGSRMIEILAGYYRHDFDHSISAKWRPATDKPGFADAVYHASIVSWKSASKKAIIKKARHFKSTLAKAERQLPSDRPGVIHIGIESSADKQIDFHRHISNMVETKLFTNDSSRLRWVCGNYFVPEATTKRDEAWAIVETMVPYKIGSHRTKLPLPGHFILTPEDVGRSGVHWDNL